MTSRHRAVTEISRNGWVGTPVIGIIALSQIADDPRVRRQGDAFAQAGWKVVGVGLAGARSAAPEWPVLDETHLHCELDSSSDGEENRLADRQPKLMRPAPASRMGEGLARTLAQHSGLSWTKRQIFRRLGQARYVIRMQAPRLWPKAAESAFWRLNTRFGDLYRVGSTIKPDIWLANDWTALPIARRLARETGAILVYDTHELAADEYTERLIWRLLHRPVTVAVERECMREAALVTCVSDGIADRLQELYGLRDRPVVIRNTPTMQEMPFRPTGEIIEVLYHGIVSPGRGLEESIRSVSQWRPEFRLTIRGPATPEYRARLEVLIAETGTATRVSLVPPVPMTELVRAANAFDVGLFALPDHSRHNRFALPNKFFEYTMAGLALCVSDLPEMARLVKAFDLGRLFTGMDPAVIAATINSLDRSSIDQYKRRSLDAARELNWQKESERLVALCDRLAAAKGK